MATRSRRAARAERQQEQQEPGEKFDAAAVDEFLGIEPGKAEPEPAPPEPPREQAQPEPEPEDGLWCQWCGHNFVGTDGETSARMAHEMTVGMVCPKCTKNIVPLDHPPEGGRAPGVPEDVQQIIESVFRIDYKGQWERLSKELMLGDNDRTDYGSVVKALDRAEDNARLAHLVFVNVRVEYERYKLDSETVEAAMRAEATETLEAERTVKAQGKERTKQITEADVRAKMAEIHPDQFRNTLVERAKFKAAVDHAEQLFERWSRRAFALQAILTTMRR